MAAPTTAEIERRWDEQAKTFEEMEKTTNVLAHTVAAAASVANLKPGQHLLDLGCGAGGAAQFVQAMLQPGVKFTISDLSSQMLERARAKVRPDVQVVQADAEHLPFPDEEFDAAYACLLLMLVSDPDACLRELKRVTKPGSIITFAIWGRAEHSPMMTLMQTCMKKLNIPSPSPPQRSNFHLGSRDDVTKRLQEHGFTKITTWYQSMVAPGVMSGEDMAELNMNIMPTTKTLFAKLTSEQAQALRTEIVRCADEILQRGDPLCLDVMIIRVVRP